MGYNENKGATQMEITNKKVNAVAEGDTILIEYGAGANNKFVVEAITRSYTKTYGARTRFLLTTGADKGLIKSFDNRLTVKVIG